jgi:hypothetical protein
VAAFEGLKKFKMVTVAMVTKVQNFFKLDANIDGYSKLCSFFSKFSKWPPFQNGRQYKNLKKSLKIQK